MFRPPMKHQPIPFGMPPKGGQAGVGGFDAKQGIEWGVEYAPIDDAHHGAVR